MGWVDDQIKQRMDNDTSVFSDAFLEMSGVVTGERYYASGHPGDLKQAAGAAEEILEFYHVPAREIPDSITEFDDILEYLLRPYGIMRRTVELTGRWYRDAYGPMMCRMKDGTVCAAIPRGLSGYWFVNSQTGKKEKISKENIDLFSTEGICFYKGFPNRKLSMKDLFLFIWESISPGDCVFLAAASLIVTLVGTLSAYANNIMFRYVIVSDKVSLLIAILILLFGIQISGSLLNSAKQLILERIRAKIRITVESATMMRVLSLPAVFFKDYSSGELTSRIQYMTAICNILIEMVLSSGLSALFSIAYIVQIVNYTPTLILPVIIVVLATCLSTTLSVLIQVKRTEELVKAQSKESGIVFSLISGIQKIKLAGAEKRAFAKWAKLYKEVLRHKYHVHVFDEISLFISALGTAVIYFFAAKSNVSVSDYMTFQVAYGMVMGAFMEASSAIVSAANLKPYCKMISPFMDTVPEISSEKTVVSRLSGNIELNNISFKYDENGPLIIDNLSLKINRGQYVAIVGTTGCGKSTLMRIMLGFEKPNKGAVYYDGKDINKLDLKSLRRSIGTVMQNDSLFSGDIYSNIVLSAPWLTVDDAWNAAEMAGIAKDIERMPMQMSTFLSEGAGSISGGQKQRLLIARAIAPKPKIIMFDEATSALDNITQKQISEALAGLRCTRIVIAHRLSTIKQCDRIIVLDKGKIIEDGSYQDLMEKGGFFSNLVRRQQITPAK